LRSTQFRTSCKSWRVRRGGGDRALISRPGGKRQVTFGTDIIRTRFDFDLVEGAEARYVSQGIGDPNPQAFVSIIQAETLGIRHTEALG
jgi:hypothetical protein